MAAIPDEAEAVSVEALFRAHYRRLCQLGILLTADPHQGEDLAQEAFARYSRTGNQLPERAAIAYLSRTVANLSHGHFRRLGVARRRMRADRSEAPDVTDELAVGRLTHQSLVSGLQSLPRRQRECLVLRYLLELPEAEVSSTLGISQNSVKTHLRRGKAALASMLGEIDD